MPFRTVYLHGLVTDEKGQKMSKSGGNAIDPLELIDKYGADALRFTASQAANTGRLRPASASRGSRNRRKLWNATRFAEMNGAALPKVLIRRRRTHRQQVRWRTGARQWRGRQGNRRIPHERGGGTLTNS